MIIFKLGCDSSHEFEGWFSDSGDFESQKQRGLLTCPVCGSSEVTKQLGGVPLLKSTHESKAEPKVDPARLKPAGSNAAPKKGVPLDPVMVLKALHQYVQKNFENVGGKFYDQAVSMHNGETPAKRICGQVTPEQAQKLEEQEIPYALVPKLSPRFEN